MVDNLQNTTYEQTCFSTSLLMRNETLRIKLTLSQKISQTPLRLFAQLVLYCIYALMMQNALNLIFSLYIIL